MTRNPTAATVSVSITPRGTASPRHARHQPDAQPEATRS